MIRSRAALALGLVVSVGAAAHAQGIATRLDSTMRAAERAGFSGVVRVEQDGVTLLEQGTAWPTVR